MKETVLSMTAGKLNVFTEEVHCLKKRTFLPCSQKKKEDNNQNAGSE